MKDIQHFNDGKIYAANIRDRRIVLALKHKLVRHASESMQAIEGAILREINSELNPKDVKIYSNESLRQAELRKRLKDHSPYNKSKDLVETTNDEIRENEIGIDYFRNMLNLVTALLT